jgi:cellulose synthase/poly-beta-1,6-N-acetylglucosamine synthase-like glycosyltransferase
MDAIGSPVPDRRAAWSQSLEIPPILRRLRIDFRASHRQPSAVRLVFATVVSLAGSLLADALLVVIGTSIFPAIKHYVHFQFHDYARLTIIGVLFACIAWPIVTRISSAPRWLFLRLAILVTLVLFAPDLWILKQGQRPQAVAILMCMHIAIALVTYNALVRISAIQPLAAAHAPSARENVS